MGPSAIRLALLAALAGLLLGREWEASRDAAAATVRFDPSRSPEIHYGIAGQRWGHTRAEDRAPDDGSALSEHEALAQLGYAAGKLEATRAGGVTHHDPDRTRPGLTLCHFGHEQAAWLLDAQGRTLHHWSLDLQRHLEPGERVHLPSWRRVHPFDDGGLLVVYEGQYLVSLDRDSNVRWIHRGGAHHDLDVPPDGRIHVLTRRTHVLPDRHPTRPCLEDFVTVLDDAGRTLRRVSILRALERSPWAPLAERMTRTGDLTHTNTLEVLDGRWAHRSPAFRAGNVLLSMREIDTIAVLDLEQERIVWALSGMWRAQHQPTVLENGHLLLFDNKGRDGLSRVLEFDPFSQAIAWQYPLDPASDFYSAECGSAQRLPDGNTLITETDTGRAFEVTPEGETVWEYVSPFRAGDRGQYVATLFEALRLPATWGEDWLPSREDG